ncbi:hypothetical protein V6B16_03215 [Salinimicrobium catena]|uniref:hypothetical protein n=1 Tax=Salinimicrobium catena TaxID=390640 RepID=UPI002FE4DCBC
MKIIKVSLLGIFFISLISCSKDDESKREISGSLIGQWNLTEFEYSGYSETKVDGMSMRADYAGIAENIDASMTFHENGTFESEGVYDVILTGEGMTLPYRDISYESSGNYVVSGNRIDITNFEGTSTPGAYEVASEKEMIIVGLTDSRLVLDVSENTTITEEDAEALISISGQYVFSR